MANQNLREKWGRFAHGKCSITKWGVSYLGSACIPEDLGTGLGGRCVCCDTVVGEKALVSWAHLFIRSDGVVAGKIILAACVLAKRRELITLDIESLSDNLGKMWQSGSCLSEKQLLDLVNYSEQNIKWFGPGYEAAMFDIYSIGSSLYPDTWWKILPIKYLCMPNFTNSIVMKEKMAEESDCALRVIEDMLKTWEGTGVELVDVLKENFVS